MNLQVNLANIDYYEYYAVNHSENYSDPITGVTANAIKQYEMGLSI